MLINYFFSFFFLEYLFFEFDTKFFREVVNVMLTDLASMYLNAILNTKKLVDFKIIILFNCKWLQCDLIAISHSFYWKEFIYLISTYFLVFEIAFKYILARSVSITFTTYVKIILSNSKDVYSRMSTKKFICCQLLVNGFQNCYTLQ